ncbi:MAG: TonB-dependent receptor, partial [Alphaproteobacteria bacterium]|nr:TonB-dependent receptor [Alphaproteobacteria bacterium]
TYVDAAGSPLTPNSGCTARLTFPYGGGGAANNPACYAVGATPVGSYRHTHYRKRRAGVTAKTTINITSNNAVHAGLWWEHTNRGESRDWHKVIDSRSSNQFDSAAYWRQYDRKFITNTLMLYAEDTATLGNLVVNGGLRKFIVDVTRDDNFGIQKQFSKKSNSKILFTAGLLYHVTDNLDVFSGFSQNFAAIKDTVIEGSASTADNTTSGAILATIDKLKGETANNYDVGLRYSNDWLHANLTGYYIKFNNRITGVAAGNSITGIDYLEAQNTVYYNVGGVESKGIEASLSADVSEHWNIYSSLTINNSIYTRTFGKAIKDNKVALSPEFQLVGTLSYNRDGMRAGISAKHVGKRWGDLNNVDRLPAFTTVDLWMGYTIDMSSMGMKSMDLSLNVTNLTDKRYLGGGTPGGYFIGPARQVMANITVRY